MQWINSEKSSLISAWGGSPDDKDNAEQSFTLSSKGDFLIVACVGDIVCMETGEISTFPNFAEIIRDDIVRFEWDAFTFERICDLYTAYFSRFSNVETHDFSETEIVFIQNEANVADEAIITEAVTLPKILELV